MNKVKLLLSVAICLCLSSNVAVNAHAAGRLAEKDLHICEDIIYEYNHTRLTDEQFEKKYNDEIVINDIPAEDNVNAIAYINEYGKEVEIPIEVECKEIDFSDYSELNTERVSTVIVATAKTKTSRKNIDTRGIRFGGTIAWVDNSGPRNELLSITVARTGDCVGDCTYSFGTNASMYGGWFSGSAIFDQPSKKTYGLYFQLSAATHNSKGQDVYFNMSTIGD